MADGVLFDKKNMGTAITNPELRDWLSSAYLCFLILPSAPAKAKPAPQNPAGAPTALSATPKCYSGFIYFKKDMQPYGNYFATGHTVCEQKACHF